MASQDQKILIRGEHDQIIEEVVNLGSDLDFELNTQNVKQCLQFDERHMSSEDLFEINQPRALEDEELEDIPENPAELFYKQLQEIVKRGQACTDFIRVWPHC